MMEAPLTFFGVDFDVKRPASGDAVGFVLFGMERVFSEAGVGEPEGCVRSGF